MNVDLHIVAGFSVLWAAIVPTPGANSLMVTHLALNAGYRQVLLAIVGNLAGIALLAVLALLGLAVVLDAASWLRLAIGVAGGGYLIWLGVKVLRCAWSAEPSASPPRASDKRDRGAKSVSLGFATALSNVQAIFFITSVFSAAGLLGASLETGFACVGVMLVLNGIWLSLLGGLFLSPLARRVYLAIKRPLEGLIGGLFLFFGGHLLLREISRAPWGSWAR